MSDDQAEEVVASDNAAGLATVMIVLTTLMLGGAWMILHHLIEKQYADFK